MKKDARDQRLREVSLTCCPLDIGEHKFANPRIVADLFDKKAGTLMKKDGPFVQLEYSSSPFNFFQDFVLAVGCVHYCIRLIVCGADVDVSRWIRAVSIVWQEEAFVVLYKTVFTPMHEFVTGEESRVFNTE